MNPQQDQDPVVPAPPPSGRSDILLKVGPLVYSKSYLQVYLGVVALILSIVPFASLIAVGVVDYATGNNHWPDASLNNALFSGIFGFVICWLYIMFNKTARSAVGRLLRSSRLHQVALVVAILSAVVVPWSIWQQNISDKAEIPIEVHLLTTSNNARYVASGNNNSFGTTSTLVEALDKIQNSLKPTSGAIHTSSQVTVAVGNGGKQAMFVTTDGDTCLGIYDQITSSNTSGKLTTVTSYADWVPPSGECIATPTQTIQSEKNSLLNYQWSSKDFGFGPLPAPSSDAAQAVSTVTTYTSWSTLPNSLQSALVSLPPQAACPSFQKVTAASYTGTDTSINSDTPVYSESNGDYVVFNLVCPQKANFLLLGANVNGSWKLVAAGPGGGGGGATCANLDAYHVPAGILIAANYGVSVKDGTYQCTDASANKVNYNSVN